jgi:lipoprotein-anchoring transpeptidase ErfK/SrfK
MILSPGLVRCLQVLLLALCIILSSASVEAGLFDKMRARKEARKEPPTVTKPTPRPQHRSSYRDAHGDAYINHELLAAGKDAEKKVVIDISRQRAFLIIHDLVAIDTAVSTARRGNYTPRGSYQITEKVASGKVSTLYHVYMPYWMRLGQSTVGMHVGDLPGYPASAGCIRLPQRIAPLLFENLTLGVPVEVVDSWDEEGLRIPYTVRKPTLFADT